MSYNPLLYSLVKRATHTVTADEVRKYLMRYVGQETSSLNLGQISRELASHFKKGDCQVTFNEETQMINVLIGTQIFTIGKANQDEQREPDASSENGA